MCVCVCSQDTEVRKGNGGSLVWGYQEIQDLKDHQVSPLAGRDEGVIALVSASLNQLTKTVACHQHGFQRQELLTAHKMMEENVHNRPVNKLDQLKSRCFPQDRI